MCGSRSRNFRKRYTSPRFCSMQISSITIAQGDKKVHSEVWGALLASSLLWERLRSLESSLSVRVALPSNSDSEVYCNSFQCVVFECVKGIHRLGDDGQSAYQQIEKKNNSRKK